jgi:hypothetical protein
MADKEDWMLRPVVRGMCGYEELKRDRLDLLDFAIMNDALDVEEENERRKAEYLANKRDRR